MKILRVRNLLASSVLTVGLIASTGRAVEEAVVPAEPSPVSEQSWYGRTAEPVVKAPTVAQQRAAWRADQRGARMASLRWYGFSASRPVAAGMPFTTNYSPQWEMPGGRPFAWYLGSRSSVIYSQPYTLYR